jgi:hypothetical protein
MREYDEPANGRQAVIDSLKDSLKVQHVAERRILSRSITSNGLTIFCEMNNRLCAGRQTLDPFYETAVIVYNEESLITELKTYSCRSHIIEIVQDQTGIFGSA